MNLYLLEKLSGLDYRLLENQLTLKFNLKIQKISNVFSASIIQTIRPKGDMIAH